MVGEQILQETHRGYGSFIVESVLTGLRVIHLPAEGEGPAGEEGCVDRQFISEAALGGFAEGLPCMPSP